LAAPVEASRDTVGATATSTVETGIIMREAAAKRFPFFFSFSCKKRIF
jgi:hypothetical protein